MRMVRRLHRQRLLVPVLILLLGIGTAAYVFAQARAGSFWRFARPGAPGTTEAELYYDSTNTVTHLTLTGNIDAGGGYKQTFSFAHPEFTIASLSQSHAPLAGNVRIATGATAGGANDRSGVVRAIYAGSVIGLALWADRAMTNGDAHAEVWTRSGTSSPVGTGLRSGVVNATNQVQRNTQAVNTDTFAAGDDFGCWIFTGSATPTNVVLQCLVVVEY